MLSIVQINARSRRHPIERVAGKQPPRLTTVTGKDSRQERGGPTGSHATLNEIACDLTLANMFGMVKQGQQSRFTQHGVPADLAEEGLKFLVSESWLDRMLRGQLRQQ